MREYQETFVNAIFFERGILLHGSFVPIVIFISLLVFMLAHAQKDDVLQRRIRLAGYFIVASAFAYVAQMYLLYAVAFPVDRYVRLSSYERYMSTFILSIMLLAVYLYYESQIWKKYLSASYAVLVLMFAYLLLFHVNSFSQVLPGNLTRDRRGIAGWEYAASKLSAATPDYAKIYVIKREENWRPLYLFMVATVFYTGTRIIHIGNIGPTVGPNQGTSKNLSPEQLYNSLKGYDYLYLNSLDQAFMDKYSVIFESPELLKSDALYKIVGSEGGMIALE